MELDLSTLIKRYAQIAIQYIADKNKKCKDIIAKVSFPFVHIDGFTIVDVFKP